MAAAIDPSAVRVVGRRGAEVRFLAPALGRGDRLTALVAEGVRGEGTARVETARRAGAIAVTEWWANEAGGIEQGFVVAERPEGLGALVVRQTLETSLEARLTEDLRTVVFADAVGERLRFAGLRVWDATGRDLSAQFAVVGDALEMRVDDTDARYPVTIDPTWSQQAYLKASNPGAFDHFGRAVAVSGDTVVVGAWGEDSAATGVNGNQADNSVGDSGAAYVFVRSGTTWSQQAYLKASNTESLDSFGGSVSVTMSGSIGWRSGATTSGWAIRRHRSIRLVARPTARCSIATTTFVAGTRPDVEEIYSTTPFHQRAGWGYMLLTWGLPNANGTFVLTAVAWDTEDRNTTLGTKSITVTNETATKPFGTIDVPSYGGTFSGHQFNFGWALTPSAGCTMAGGEHYMTINSAPPFFVVNYGANRPDVAAAFPGFVDSHAAGGSVALNSTLYPDGTYTIGWVVYDSCGNGEGLGSRFFRILNSGAPAALADPAVQDGGPAGAITARGPTFGRVGQALDALSVRESSAPLWLARGMGRPATALDRAATVWLSQTGRIELHATAPGESLATDTTFEAYLAVNGALAPLPVGSSFDAARGVFYWQPVAGFLGDYPIRILRLRDEQVVEQWTTSVVVSPGVDEVLLQVDVSGPVFEGWALDPSATDGSGIGAVHVWARRVTGTATTIADTFFVGHATLGHARPDVAAVYGAQFGAAGYRLALPPMAPGTYEVIVYAWSERTGRWEAARVTTVRVG